jgi:hypothetical protein
MGSRTCNQNTYTNLYLHIWFITKTWLNFLMDDLEEDLDKNEKIKKTIIHIIIFIIIYNSFIF